MELTLVAQDLLKTKKTSNSKTRKMKKIFLLIAAIYTLPAFAQEPRTSYHADSLLSRWVIDVNLLGGLNYQTYLIANTTNNYPNFVNPNTGELNYKNGYTYGAEAQVGYFFGKSGHLGIGTGIMYLQQQGDAEVKNFHMEYQSTDFEGSTFRQVVNGIDLSEHLVTTNINIPLLMKYKNRFSKRWGFSTDAGVLFNLQMKNAYTQKGNFDYEAIYKYNQNGVAVYDNATYPSVNDWFITKAEFQQNNPDGNYQAYINAKRALGFNLGEGVSPTSPSGNVSYTEANIGVIIHPSMSYYLSDHAALTFGLYYMMQPFKNNAENGYQMTNAVGSYSSVLNTLTSVINQSVGVSIGARFFLGNRRLPKVLVAEAPVVVNEVQFSVKAPEAVIINRRVKEIFPLRNAVFFDMGSTQIPDRYIQMNRSNATSFNETQLQQDQPDNLNRGRASRQLAVYYNILNITGDRMRNNPQTSLTLIGSSDKNPAEGKLMAEQVKQYLVDVYGIDASRIKTEGRSKPIIPSEERGATKDLSLLHEEDRKVEIESSSPELLMEVGGTGATYLKPVQITNIEQDQANNRVAFYADGASASFKSWSVQLTDEQGNIQNYGPYINDRASVNAKTILGNKLQGNYTVVMTGETNSGQIVKRNSTLTLSKAVEMDAKQDGLRYSILFDFDKSKTISEYHDFLVNVVAPLVPNNATIVIHGHTDIIGDEQYNLNLSPQRAKDAQQIIETALSNEGKTGVKFESTGFGKDEVNSPFENKLPEERFYNRTVIIDIIPVN
jgi:outer membrane protein OmpA-like peptidoglycan-associated protein